MTKNKTLKLLIDLSPALAVLLLTLITAFFYGALAPLTKMHTNIWMALFRFLRFTIILLLPFLILPKAYHFITAKLKTSLIRFEQKKSRQIKPFKHWLFRPIQGIGIGLVFSTKLIAALQIISGPSDGSSILIVQSHYQPARLAAVMLITAVVSLLLSVLWALDDTGIRYFNRKDHELKMIGKYAGTVVPFVFGIYGILNIIANYSTVQALLVVFQIIAVLYPPMSIFAVLHAYFLANKTAVFLNSNLKAGSIRFE